MAVAACPRSMLERQKEEAYNGIYDEQISARR
jgi:hypothetical protein